MSKPTRAGSNQTDNTPGSNPAGIEIDGWRASSARPLRRSRIAALVDFLFPPRCVVCRSRGNWLCGACRPGLTLFSPPLCRRCGLPVEPGAACAYCSPNHRQRLPVEARRVCGYYDGALREAIHRFKFGNERYLASHLAELMADTWAASPMPTDILVPVPLGAKREAERGYNQSALLARESGRLIGLPVNERLLRRRRETPPQMGLQRDDRLRNLAGAFTCDRGYVTGLRICLVDDVTTTGSTLAACATALRSAGAASVCALVLACVE